MGIFNPGELPEGEGMNLNYDDNLATRNNGGSLGVGGKGSMASDGKESVISLPEESMV